MSVWLGGIFHENGATCQLNIFEEGHPTMVNYSIYYKIEKEAEVAFSLKSTL